MLDNAKSQMQAIGLNIAEAKVIQPAPRLDGEPRLAAEVFGLDCLGSYEVDVLDPHTLPVPSLNPHYLFRAEKVKPILGWLEHSGGDAYSLSGPHGCSKTSTFTQIAARLNIPTIVYSVNEQFDFHTDLVGTIEAVNGTTFFRYGPLALAMHHGMLLVLNEADTAKPGALTGAYDAFEGGDLFIPQTNEVIKPHPDFRVAMCTNTNGAGDETGMYRGRKIQCGAFMDRFRGDTIDYPSPNEEFEILERRFPQLGRPLVTRMVSYAAETRTASNGDVSGLSSPISVRTICRAAEIMQSFGVAVSDDSDLPDFAMEIVRSWELSYWFKLSSADRQAAITIFETTFGIRP